MKKLKSLFGKAREKAQDLCIRAHTLLTDRKGDLAVSTIGGIIIAVVMVGLIIVAIKAFFPNFFTTMFNSMQTKLNKNW